MWSSPTCRPWSSTENPPWWARACGTITPSAHFRFFRPATCGSPPKTPRAPVQKTKAPKKTTMNPRPSDRLYLWLCAAALALATTAASAQQAAPEEEPDTLILSDTHNYTDATKESTFT